MLPGGKRGPLRCLRDRAHWRPLALAGLTTGLALSPLAPARPAVAPVLVALVQAGVSLGRLRWSVPLALVALLCGLLAGSARLHAIDSGAAHAEPGRAVTTTGFLTAPPRRQTDGTALELRTPAGRMLA